MAETVRIDKERARRAREAIERLGISQTALARALGVNPRIVNEVVRGRLVGVRGDTHKVAVALGIKDGVIPPKDASAEELIALLRRAAKGAA